MGQSFVSSAFQLAVLMRCGKNLRRCPLFAKMYYNSRHERFPPITACSLAWIAEELRGRSPLVSGRFDPFSVSWLQAAAAA